MQFPTYHLLCESGGHYDLCTFTACRPCEFEYFPTADLALRRLETLLDPPIAHPLLLNGDTITDKSQISDILAPTNTTIFHCAWGNYPGTGAIDKDGFILVLTCMDRLWNYVQCRNSFLATIPAPKTTLNMN